MSESRVLMAKCEKCSTWLRVKTHSAERIVPCPKCGASVTATQTPDHHPPPNPPDGSVHAFPCPDCGSELIVGRQLIGKTIVCRECEQRVRVPSPANPAEEGGTTVGPYTSEDLAAGRQTTITAFLLLIGMQLASVTLYFAQPSPVEFAEKRAEQRDERMKQVMPFLDNRVLRFVKESEQQQIEIQRMVQTIHLCAVGILSGLLTILYVGKADWARVVLGLLCLLMALLVAGASIYAVAQSELQFYNGVHKLLGYAEMIGRICVMGYVGGVLLFSDRVRAYSLSRLRSRVAKPKSRSAESGSVLARGDS